MSQWIAVVNDGAVGLFGALLSAAFCPIQWTRRSKRLFACALAILGALQALLYVSLGGPQLRLWYPAVTHLPLVVLLAYLSRRWLWSLSAVLTAYLCCQFRRWLALLFVAVFGGGSLMQAAVELALTLPLLWLLLRFAAPAVRGMSQQSLAVQWQFTLIPAVSYLFDYVTRIYTDLLLSGSPVVVEFMPFVCAAGYLAFVLHFTQAQRRQSELEQLQTLLHLQVKQAAQQITDMKQAQDQAAAYRHDLRHHLQFLSICLQNGELEQAKQYIIDLSAAIPQPSRSTHCENTVVNLVLSSFATQAQQAGIAMEIRVRLPEALPIQSSDLIVLLSNALENALHACQSVPAASIGVNGYESAGHVFLEIINSCHKPVPFANGLPVTHEKGHGLGVRSICAVVEKYGGLYSFEMESGRFILRVSL